MHNRNRSVYHLVVAALLTAIGILIPLVMPVRIAIGPMSFTLASHVPLFIAMFLSPGWLGTTLGFQLAGFPLVVVLRAASQIVFALVGALWVRRSPRCLDRPGESALLALVTGVIHGVCEGLVVLYFFFGGAYTGSVFYVVVLLTGVGTLVHSCVDYLIALIIWKPLRKSIQRG